MKNQRFISVMVGGDVGVYAMARSMHETYAVRTTVVSSVATASVSYSKFIDNIYIGDIFNEQKLFETLAQISLQHPVLPKLLFVNIDPLVGFASKYRSKLEELGYKLPFPKDDVVGRLSDKWEFAKACIKLGINTPVTVAYDFKKCNFPEIPFVYPIVAKSAVNAPWHNVEFEGKKKVHLLRTKAELDDLVSKLSSAGFKDKIVIQEFVPGNDTTTRSVSIYVNSKGIVTFGCCARVLLQDHVPTAIGIPLAMIPYYDDELIGQATKLVATFGYHGFANFDVKIDRNDGKAKFFEINPRAGMNIYYVHAAGISPAKHMVTDMIWNISTELEKPNKHILYSRLPVNLLKKYILDDVSMKEINSIIKGKNVFNPLKPKYDNSFKRWYYTTAVLLNYYRKFAKYYPAVSEDAF